MKKMISALVLAVFLTAACSTSDSEVNSQALALGEHLGVNHSQIHPATRGESLHGFLVETEEGTQFFREDPITKEWKWDWAKNVHLDEESNKLLAQVGEGKLE